MLSDIRVHSSIGRELQTPDLGRFYKRNGHKGRIQSDDRCIWLSLNKKIIAAARLSELPDKFSPELNKILILRGVWVDKQQRNEGLGSLLLQEILKREATIEQNIYCFAYQKVIPFYRKQGFKSISESAPPYLRQKQQGYKSRGHTTELMVYSK